MTRNEFLNELRRLLYELPPDEREAALQYYTEYFDDAGPENEQRVLQELGSPQKVARQILSGCPERYAPPVYTRPLYGDPARPARRFSWWMILAMVLLAPIVLPLLLALAIVAATLVFVAFILIAVFVIVVVALILGGLGGIIGLPYLFSGPFYGVTRLGMAIFALGLGLILVGPCVSLLTRGVPAFCRRLQDLLRWRP